MKNIILTIGITLLLSSNSFGANNQNLLYYVDSFYANSDNVESIITQEKTETNSSCGPTSLLFLYNHFYEENNWIKPDFIKNTPNAQTKLAELYSYIGKQYNSTTSLTELRNIAKFSWQWENVYRMSSASGVNTNVGYLIDYLDNDIPALVVLDSNFSRNPTKGDHDIDHIVIVYAYHKLPDDNGNVSNSPYNDRQNDRIYFYDPYKGGNGYFTRGEINTATYLTGFAFLAVAP